VVAYKAGKLDVTRKGRSGSSLIQGIFNDRPSGIKIESPFHGRNVLARLVGGCHPYIAAGAELVVSPNLRRFAESVRVFTQDVQSPFPFGDTGRSGGIGSIKSTRYKRACQCQPRVAGIGVFVGVVGVFIGSNLLNARSRI